MDTKVVLITGASSGFGFLTTLALAKSGYTVIATMRNLSKGNRLEEEANHLGVNQFIDIRNPFLGVKVGIAITGVYPSRN